MSASDTNGEQGSLDRIGVLARNALDGFGVPPDAQVEMINYSENITYRVDDGDSGHRFALRVHRPGYHSLQNIESELAWMEALTREAGVPTPVPVPAPDGTLVRSASAQGVPDERYCVLFQWLDGDFPDEDRLLESFGPLGEITGRVHAHASGWKPPASFKRQTWDLDFMFGKSAIWGSWQDGMGLTTDDLKLLDRLESRLRERLERFGQSPERFGLIHADLRLDNVLVENGETKVIDFDDCGLGWYLYDFGTAVSFIEHRPDMDELIAAWVDCYRKVRAMSEEEENEIQTFVMVRRLLLTAWIASHSDTELAQAQGLDYTRGTCALAEDYLGRYT